jgi:DNA-directed RNA polymerase specialized sigma24 family protein
MVVEGRGWKVSRYSLHFYRVGDAPSEKLADTRFQSLVSYHAHRLAYTAPGQVDSHYYEDLYQEGMVAAFRLLERDPTMYGRTLLRFSVLAMYAARKRGRSVFRADPASRLRTYEQVFFEHDMSSAELNAWADAEVAVSEAYELDW